MSLITVSVINLIKNRLIYVSFVKYVKVDKNYDIRKAQIKVTLILD